MPNYPGLIHDVYYLVTGDGKPIPGTGTVWPSVAEFEAWARDDGSKVAVWSRKQTIPVYGQRDPLWKDEKLGFGVVTIGDYGCVITSLAMMLSGIEDREITPLDVNEALKEVNGFTGDTKNLVVWSAVQRVYPSVLFQGLDICVEVAAPVTKIDNHIKTSGSYCIVQVDMNPSPQMPGIQGHYLLIIGGNSSDGYTINDPWRGQTLSLPPAYCLEGWNAARAITRVTYWDSAKIP